MGLTNPRSVMNAWTGIKKKMAESSKKYREAEGPPSDEDDEASARGAQGAESPGPAAPKKRARAGAQEAGDGGPAVKKRARVAKTAGRGKAAPNAKTRKKTKSERAAEDNGAESSGFGDV